MCYYKILRKYKLFSIFCENIVEKSLFSCLGSESLRVKKKSPLLLFVANQFSMIKNYYCHLTNNNILVR